MHVPRLYIDAPLAVGERLCLPAEASRHVMRVLRLRRGADLVVFNGRGGQFAAVIDALDKKVVTVRVGAFDDGDCESPLQIRLLPGISRGERMDYSIQKAVELGVAGITPIWTQRSMVRLDPGRAARRLAHWRSITINACEQCGRNRVPIIDPPLNLLDAVTQTDPSRLRLVLSPTAKDQLGAQPTATTPIDALVGPEGGLSAEELEQVVALGYRPIRLGPRILRTETASITILTALQTLWGDLG